MFANLEDAIDHCDELKEKKLEFLHTKVSEKYKLMVLLNEAGLD